MKSLVVLICVTLSKQQTVLDHLDSILQVNSGLEVRVIGTRDATSLSATKCSMQSGVEQGQFDDAENAINEGANEEAGH